MSSKTDPENSNRPPSGYSRRGFLRGVGIGGGAIGILEKDAAAQAPAAGKVLGPGAVPVTLKINGKPVNLTIEPRVTLIDALRNQLDITGAKRACDRGTCGSCTVIMNGKVVYACDVLAIDAQDKDIQTIEGLQTGPRPHPVVTAFVNNDAQQCGYCTPGFVMAAKGFIDKNPNPTYEQVSKGLGGNICRCGTYMGVRRAVLDAAKEMKGAKNA